MQNIEQFVLDIVAQENERHGDRFDAASITPLGLPAIRLQTSVSTVHFRIRGVNAEDDAIISVSNSTFPDAVAGAIACADAFATAVGKDGAAPMVRPSAAGRWNKQSYAFWPEFQPLSDFGPLRRVQIMSINQTLFAWLSKICMNSKRMIEQQQAFTDRYLTPIESLLSDSDFSAGVKRAAEKALATVQRSSFQAVSIAHHGDLWRGNVMINKKWPRPLHRRHEFHVIDWGGAGADGYPYVDLVRYLVSCNAGKDVIDREITSYSAACGLNGGQAQTYICASMGQLGLNLNEFPKDQYLRLCDAMVSATSSG